MLKKYGDYRIFLDLKLYDIPNTMLDAIAECQKIGVDMPKSIPAYTVEEAEKIANDLGYPVVVSRQ